MKFTGATQNMQKLKLIIALLFATMMFTSVYAESSIESSADIEARLSEKVKEVLGSSVVVNSIKPTPLENLYEVVFDNGKVVYLSKDGRYVFEGDMMDLVDRQNLTENSRLGARGAAFENIDVSKLIEYAPEKTEHVLYVYTDIDCGYCQKFHKQVKSLNENGIAVRYLAFPRAGLESSAYVAAESAWCADDKKSALTAAKAGKNISPAVCDSRVADQYNLGQSMGVRGTPTVYLASGKEMGGYIPAEELIRFFKGGL